MTEPNETANLVNEITGAFREHRAGGVASKLTASDLDIIGRARELADTNDVERFAPDAVSPTTAYVEAFGEAQYLLAQLADLAERLAGE